MSEVDYTQANQFFAEKCGVTIEPDRRRSDDRFIWQEHGAPSMYWTIEDPRCREIVREKFNLCTSVSHNGWICKTWDAHRQYAYPSSEFLPSIAEGELACLMAIYLEAVK